jgi:hypothetical protein
MTWLALENRLNTAIYEFMFSSPKDLRSSELALMLHDWEHHPRKIPAVAKTHIDEIRNLMSQVQPDRRELAIKLLEVFDLACHHGVKHHL